jgi:hypothetical protein
MPAKEENELGLRNFIIFCLRRLEEAAKSSTTLAEDPESIENSHKYAYLDPKKLLKLLPQTQDMLQRLAENCSLPSLEMVNTNAQILCGVL